MPCIRCRRSTQKNPIKWPRVLGNTSPDPTTSRPATTNERLAVIGAGAWGTALAIRWARSGRLVGLWGRDSVKMKTIRARGENRDYLPGVILPPTIEPHTSLSQCLALANYVLIAVPSAGFKDCIDALQPILKPHCGVMWATKGLEPLSGQMLEEVARTVLGERPYAVIGGPTFAREVACDLPAAVHLASQDIEFAERLSLGFAEETFRVYISQDTVGVSVAGAVKNILAIAAGIADGMSLGANTRAALISRGLAEMMRFGRALGARAETFMGLAGLGDLVLTCTDDQSRNRRFGLALGRGVMPETAEREIGVVEGRRATAAVVARARALDIDMPITRQVHHVLRGDTDVSNALKKLLARTIRSEFEP